MSTFYEQNLQLNKIQDNEILCVLGGKYLIHIAWNFTCQTCIHQSLKCAWRTTYSHFHFTFSTSEREHEEN